MGSIFWRGVDNKRLSAVLEQIKAQHRAGLHCLDPIDF